MYQGVWYSRGAGFPVWQCLFAPPSLSKSEWVWVGLRHCPSQQTQNMCYMMPGRRGERKEVSSSRQQGQPPLWVGKCLGYYPLLLNGRSKCVAQWVCSTSCLGTQLQPPSAATFPSVLSGHSSSLLSAILERKCLFATRYPKPAHLATVLYLVVVLATGAC